MNLNLAYKQHEYNFFDFKIKKIARITVYFDLFENINNFKFGFIASAVA